MNIPKREILVIGETEEYLREVSALLEGTDVNVHTARGASRGEEMAGNLPLDGLILDIQMKETDGIELCRIIKSDPKTRDLFILFYTSEEEEYVQIAGLNAGADDYIIRPVRPRILLSRIQALLKRRAAYQNSRKSQVIRNGNVVIDREKYTVVRDGEKIILPRKEFELLCLLVSKPGKVYSRIELSSLIWGEEKEVKGRTIDVHIRKIREKLGNESIRTVKGIGYKWSENGAVNNGLT